jgi:peptidoglycan/xylan/chitin deacetylase (PgdA/CDA1 family)
METMNIKNLGRFNLRNKEDKYKSLITIKKMIKNKISDINTLMKQISHKLNVVTPSYLINDLFLSWDDVKEMNKNSVFFGGHTLTHHSLNKCDNRKAQIEIRESKKIIENNINRKINVFSYPYGESKYFNKNSESIVRNNGFTFAVSTELGINTFDDNINYFSLKRMVIQNTDSTIYFKLKLNKILISLSKYLNKKTV